MARPSERYSELRNAASVNDAARPPVDPPEIEVQALWFAGLLGRRFETLDGRVVEVVDFGRWNREAGPDFQDVVLRWEDGGVVKGPVEIDRDARDWERHGHALNPAFEEVILHSFWNEPRGGRFFTRTASNRAVPQVRLSLVSGEEFQLGHPALARPGRCVAPLAGLGQARVDEILASAALHRLKAKGARLRRMIEARGEEEALFMMSAEALGYRDNKLPMLLLAQRVPLSEVRLAGTSGLALLFGVAGFLERERPAGDPPGEVLRHYRELWEDWWRMRSRFAHLVLDRRHWRAAGRPQNHPHRRLAALSALAAHWRAFKNRISRSSPEGFQDWIGAIGHPFWSRRYSLLSKSTPNPIALVGPERCRDIFANVVVPWRLSARGEGWEAYTTIRGAALNSRAKIASIRLFGGMEAARPHHRFLYQQQGLLQIYDDFCLADRSDCAGCPFPELLGRW